MSPLSAYSEHFLGMSSGPRNGEKRNIHRTSGSAKGTHICRAYNHQLTINYGVRGAVAQGVNVSRSVFVKIEHTVCAGKIVKEVDQT